MHSAGVWGTALATAAALVLTWACVTASAPIIVDAGEDDAPAVHRGPDHPEAGGGSTWSARP